MAVSNSSCMKNQTIKKKKKKRPFLPEKQIVYDLWDLILSL